LVKYLIVNTLNIPNILHGSALFLLFYIELTFKDTVLTTAILDRILYRCEIIKLSGKSYRMQHRKTIFDEVEN